MVSLLFFPPSYKMVNEEEALENTRLTSRLKKPSWHNMDCWSFGNAKVERTLMEGLSSANKDM